MSNLAKINLCTGTFWLEFPEAKLYVLCGCPADSVKHLRKKGLIVSREEGGLSFETGPNAILLSDAFIQNGLFSNLSEFPILQMLYLQGMMLSDHPANTGQKPLIIGSEEQVKSQIKYIHRGNYGLVSVDEMKESGISAKRAKELMRMKLKFALGQIKPTEELLDYRFVGSKFSEIKNGVFIRRIRWNVFEFLYKGEKVTVNLNLEPKEYYEPPYRLGFHRIKREYFSVVHSGEGDGWDENHPCMSSILIFQGKIYLIDAGPNISYILESLGIGVNEVEGVFQTHAHDDHFAGLTALMRSDHKIKYYSYPLVRTSVTKKLSALVSMEEESFLHYFEIRDLALDQWNDINSLEVKPMFSPHPVETTIFIFRAMCEQGYRSYGHFADIASLDVLRKMITSDETEAGISEEFYNRTKRKYLTKTDLKKLDIGGGMIHGSAEDFKNDQSGKIILSHTSMKLSERQKLIGSGTSFGMVDTLIPSSQDYVRKCAYDIVSSLFQELPRDKIDILLNNRIETFNPRSIIIKKGEIIEYVYMILSGDVETIQSETFTARKLSAGGCIGLISGLKKKTSNETYRAVNFVQALKIPSQLFLEFLKKNLFYDDMVILQERQEFLKNTWLFGEELSATVQNNIAREIEINHYRTKEEIVSKDKLSLILVKDGKLDVLVDKRIVETLEAGDFIGESVVLFGLPCIFRVVAKCPATIYHVHPQSLSNVPIIRWKLYENYLKRMRKVLDSKSDSISFFRYKKAFDTNIAEIDNDHKELFKLLQKFYQSIQTEKLQPEALNIMNLYINKMDEHFIKEENIMTAYAFSDTELHCRKHKIFKEKVFEIKKKLEQNDIQTRNLSSFFRDWIINHVLTEDRKIGAHVMKIGIV